MRFTTTDMSNNTITINKFVHSAENIDDKQGLLFNEDEAIKAETQNECDAKDKTNVNSYTRKKGGRKPLPENLERKVILNDLPEEQKHCTCGRELVEISRDVNEKLVFVPASIYVERLVTPNYVCPCCSKAKEKTANETNENTKTNIISSPIPPAILPGSIASPQLLSYIFTAKFCDGLPYYRLEKQF
ncbi:MAG: hypothetical protein Ta2B_11480 [Termitinemataceae bacterium]|nr:MAG: hypothetical protein Ta2B_11480 [Termitinemataceae bacterium]